MLKSRIFSVYNQKVLALRYISCAKVVLRDKSNFKVQIMTKLVKEIR